MRKIALLALAMALAGCGGEGSSPEADAPNVAEGTSAAVGGAIRSGTLTLRMLASADDVAPIGFELSGPFAFRERNLPIADLSYTRFAGEKEVRARFVSTGERAFVEVAGSTCELAPEQVDNLRGDGDATGLDLNLDRWVIDPAVSDAEAVDGVPMQRIEGRLDIATALVDLARLAGGFGAGDFPALKPKVATELDRAARSATFEALVGEKDGLVRSLVAELELGGSDDLPAALRQLGATLRIELKVDDPNGEIRVEAPADVVGRCATTPP
jgi:hypothetical protein